MGESAMVLGREFQMFVVRMVKKCDLMVLFDCLLASFSGCPRVVVLWLRGRMSFAMVYFLCSSFQVSIMSPLMRLYIMQWILIFSNLSWYDRFLSDGTNLVALLRTFSILS